MVATIIIGGATLYLGDAKELLPVIGAVDALVMDPPYLINTSGGGKMRKERRNMEQITAAGIDKGFDLNLINPALYGSIVSFCHNDQQHILLPFFAEHFRRHVTCYWEKTNPMPVANRNYQANIEPYIHAWQKDRHPVGTLADLKRTIVTTNGQSKYDHPTVKPDKVMNKIMKNVNASTILDPFMGTGSTGIAALRHGKKFIGIEKNPEYFAIACQRFFELYGVEMLPAFGG